MLKHTTLIAAGHVYEKRLIEAYISENGTEPGTGEDLSVEDLIDLKTARTVRPRPPTLTSIPSLLGVFQDEWDALALETYTLKQNLAQTRQELSTALYQHDAAVRVIARLTKERDEARDALSKVSVGARTAPSNGDAMQVDNAALPDEVVARIDATQQAYVSCDTDEMTGIDRLLGYLRRDASVQFRRTGLREMRSRRLLLLSTQNHYILDAEHWLSKHRVILPLSADRMALPESIRSLKNVLYRHLKAAVAQSPMERGPDLIQLLPHLLAESKFLKDSKKSCHFRLMLEMLPLLLFIRAVISRPRWVAIRATCYTTFHLHKFLDKSTQIPVSLQNAL